MTSEKEFKIVMPSNVKYSCLRCGGCCRGWQVALDEAEEERIAAAGPPAGPAAFEPVVRRPHSSVKHISVESSVTRRIALRPDGSCPFLGEGNLCLVHDRLGGEAKPLTCRAYPVKLVYTPDGCAYACVSYFCPSVCAEFSPKPSAPGAHETTVLRTGGDDTVCAEFSPKPPAPGAHDDGAPFSIDDIAAIARADNDRVTLGEKLTLEGDIEVGYADLVSINDFLSDFLFAPANAAHHNVPGYSRCAPAWDDVGATIGFDDRVIVASYFTAILSRMAKKIVREDPADFAARFSSALADRASLVELLKRCISAKADAPVKSYAKLFLVSVAHMVMANRPGATGIAKAAGVMAGLMKYAVGFGSIAHEGFGLAASVRRHLRTAADVHDASVSGLLERYVSQMIFRKRIFYASGVVKGYQHILVYYALVKWFAAAFAAGRKADPAGRGDFVSAIRLVDREFAYHSVFFETIADNEGFMKIVGMMLENFSFAKSLLKA